MNYLLKKFGKKSSVKLPEHFTSIDELPVIRWEKIHDTGKMQYLLVKTREISTEEKIELEKIWNSLYEEYLKVFGFSDQFITVMEIKIRRAKLVLKKISTDDESLVNFIADEDRKMKALMTNNRPSDIFKAKRAIESQMKIYIPMKEISVREFCSYLKDLK